MLCIPAFFRKIDVTRNILHGAFAVEYSILKKKITISQFFAVGCVVKSPVTRPLSARYPACVSGHCVLHLHREKG